MTRPVTIVMYHYVRDLAQSQYPEIKGLTVDRFAGQLDYLERHYTIIDAETLFRAIGPEQSPLPRNAALLTFDDGYRDHYETVLPMLRDRALRGLFFPPARTVMDHVVLDVNKIHFVLASAVDKSSLVLALDAAVDRLRGEYDLEATEKYHARWRQASRFDEPEVVYIKSMLQKGLPAGVRSRIVDELFHRYVAEDQARFARDLYMGVDELRALRDAGMYVGHHGFAHIWLDACAEDEQRSEVDRGLSFLESVGTSSGGWIMCYPYGAWDERLLESLRARRCVAGFTTRVDIADLDTDHPLLLPRLDTNDLPHDALAAPVFWTEQVMN